MGSPRPGLAPPGNKRRGSNIPGHLLASGLYKDTSVFNPHDILAK